MDSARKIISLDGEWQFAYTKEPPEETENFPDKEQYETKLPIPAYWDDCRSILKNTKFWSRDCNFNPKYRQIEFPMGGLKPPDASLPYIVGTGWYKKIIKAEKDWGNKTVTLHIGGAMLDAYVWLNGRLLAKRLSNGNPFDVILDEALIPGKDNEILIAVSNTRTNCNGCSIRGYKGKSAGLNRSVSIQLSEGARIADCYVHTNPDMNRLIWEIKIDSKYDNNYSLKWRIVDNADVIAKGTFNAKSNKFVEETESFGLTAWSDSDPKLYKLQLELYRGDKRVDTLEQNYGFRFVKSEGDTIFLNKKPIILRGLTDHAYFPETCTVTNNVSYYMRTIKALKEIGFNWTRFHTTIPPEEYLEAADCLGMTVQVETQNGFEKEDFVNMLLLCRKHPSVILYCCGNEVPVTEEFESKLAQMSEICHSLAPDCMYNPMEALLRVECLFTEEEDGYTETPVPHNAARLGKMRGYSDVFGTAVWVYSYNSLEPNIKKIDEKLSIYKKPCLIHEAGIFDTYINLDMEHRYDGTRIGTDLFASARKYMKEMGVLQNAAVYYRNSCKWMMQITKFTMEKMRRCKYVGGYDFLGAADCHWHRTGYAVGMLNEFYELKAASTVESIQQFNGESVILSDVSHKRNFFEGELIDVKIYSSLYGGEDIQEGILRWNLTDENGAVYLSGQKQLHNVENGKLCELGKLSVKAPHIEGIGKHMKLKVILSGGKYLLTNEWDYWIFSKLKKTSEGEVRTLKRLTSDDAEYLQNGGKVLLLGGEPFDTLPTTFQIASGGRVEGNTATVIYDHPIMRNFPHNGFCDWQFMPMLEGGEAVLFNGLNIEFKPIIEVISTYKMIRKQAALFELKVGKGKLLVCGLNMNTQDAAAEKLYERIIEYTCSEEFNPSVQISPERLNQIIEAENNIEVDFSTDECFDDGGYAAG